MAVADGLLARFRPVAGLTPKQIAGLAQAANAFGSGRIEITARGNIQIRGLSAQTEADFRTTLDAMSIEAQTGVSIEHSPIAGGDPEEIRDPLPLARALKAICAEAQSAGPLSPKLSIVLDSRGQISPGPFKADIRLRAHPEGWELSVGGQLTGVYDEEAIPAAVADILGRLQAIGPRARGHDLSPLRVAAGDDGSDTREQTNINGAIHLKGGRRALRVTLPYGQVMAEQFSSLARLMESHGVSEAWPAPERTLVLIGAESQDLYPALLSLGFGGSGFPLCSGAEVSEHGIIHAADFARALAAAAPDLAEGRVHLHVATCAKGCAHKGRPGIMLSGDMLHVYDGETQKPFARLDPRAIEAGLVLIAAQIRDGLNSGA